MITNGGKPRLSQSRFVAPGSISVKKTLSIKDVVSDPPIETTPTVKNVVEEKKEMIDHTTDEVKSQSPIYERTEVAEVSDNVVEEISDNATKEESDNATIEQPIPIVEDTSQEEEKEETSSSDLLMEVWNKMLDILFEKVPTILFPLKNQSPLLKDKILHARVKNNFQLEQFESKKRDVLAYFRNHLDPTIEDISIDIDAKMESKKIIYDQKDKLAYLQNENPQLRNFIEILKLTIKE